MGRSIEVKKLKHQQVEKEDNYSNQEVVTMKYYVQMLATPISSRYNGIPLDEPNWYYGKRPNPNSMIEDNWLHEVAISEEPFEKDPMVCHCNVYSEIEIDDDVDECYLLYHFHDCYYDVTVKRVYYDKEEVEQKFEQYLLRQQEELDRYIRSMNSIHNAKYHKEGDTAVIMQEERDKIRTSSLYEYSKRDGLFYPDKGSRWFLQTLIRGEDF